ncbi:MAG: nucleotide exchange factor GrpE [Planctomycetota bacterium]|nr:nucleotide exchange factor GrpE [Planctomycetaceae bacterium]MDQ3332919.1 nucleotide exchange factor GrpE [Planctomycetota bacterium]
MTEEPEEQDDPNAEGESGEPQASPEVASLAEQLEATRVERDENYNLALRTQAELENYRRRVSREREDDARYRVLPLAKDLLPAFDNLRRAVQVASASGNADDLIRGVEMVLKQIDDALAAHAVKPIASEGEAFDPNRHDALTQVPSAEHPPMTVLQEVERGYTLHDRVLRPSKVIVAVAPPEQG